MLPERLLSVGAILAPSHTAIGKGYRVLRSLGRGSLLLVLLLGFALASSHNARAQMPATPPNFKVAFLGDMSINANAEDVLQLIENEGADMAIHLGDLGYGNESDPQRAIDWDAQVTNVLGANYPYFAVTGSDGSFELPNLPPGEYTIEAWHEEFGVQEMKVTVGEKASVTTDFTFGG